MNEAGAGRHLHGRAEAERSAERQRRKLARLHALEAESDEALLAALPPLGTTVDGLVLESILGQGGYGTVYLARRDGRLYAVKFTYLPQAAPWALRELGTMVRLETVGGVGLRGHGLWPPEQPAFQFIVMDHVPGWELYTWAWNHNANALDVVDVLLDLTRDLGAAHRMGVVHRDVRGENVLVREADGRAVLVDFGVATYPGAPRATGAEVPGCREYLCPEVVRFNRGEREHHEASGLDDLWSLGVVTYKLLTTTYPFQGRNAVEMERAILHEAPVPPHERNPRVPVALSKLCLRLLEKEPGARYPDTRALHAALMEVKQGADETWKAPLREASGPDASTPHEPSAPAHRPPAPAPPRSEGRPLVGRVRGQPRAPRRDGGVAVHLPARGCAGHLTRGDPPSEPTTGVLSHHPGAGWSGSGAPVEAAGR